VGEAWKQALTFGALAEGPRLDPALMFGDVFKEMPPHLEAQRAEMEAELAAREAAGVAQGGAPR